MIGLTNNEEGKKILKAAKVTGFQKVSNSDYNKVREITKFALGEQY